MLNNSIQAFLNQFDKGSWQSHLLISIVALIGVYAIHLIFFMILKRIASKTKNELLEKISAKFKLPAIIFLLGISIYFLLDAYAKNTKIAQYSNKIISLLIIFCISWLIIVFIKLGKDIILRNYDIQEKDNLKARRIYTQFRILERIAIFIVVVISIAFALMTFESIQKIGISIFASAGIAGIIIGFAAQKLIATVLAGFQIAITQPIRLDDVVIVEGEWGWIEDINLTYVVVRIWDKRRLIVPTPYFIEKPFQNWTRVSADILGTVYIYTDYTVPVDKIREELTRILKKDKNWDGNVNVLQVTNSTEHTIELRALMSAVDSPTAWNLRVNVREQLINFLQENYPQSLPRTRLMLEKEEN